MNTSRTWIDKNLSFKEKRSLVDWLMERSADPTGQLILDGLQEMFPQFEDYPSIASCLNWKKASWAFELHTRRLRAQSTAAGMLAQAGDGSKLDEANRVMLQAMIFEQLTAMQEGRVQDLDPELLDKMVKGVSVLARQGMAERELQVKLEKLETEKRQLEASVKEVAEDDDLTPEQRLAKIRKGLGI